MQLSIPFSFSVFLCFWSINRETAATPKQFWFHFHPLSLMLSLLSSTPSSTFSPSLSFPYFHTSSLPFCHSLAQSSFFSPILSLSCPLLLLLSLSVTLLPSLPSFLPFCHSLALHHCLLWTRSARHRSAVGPNEGSQAKGTWILDSIKMWR